MGKFGKVCLWMVFLGAGALPAWGNPYWEISAGIDGPNTCRVGETINISIYGMASDARLGGFNGYFFTDNSGIVRVNQEGLIDYNAGGAAWFHFHSNSTNQSIYFMAAPGIHDVFTGKWFTFSFTGLTPGLSNFEFDHDIVGGLSIKLDEAKIIVTPEPITAMTLVTGGIFLRNRRLI